MQFLPPSERCNRIPIRCYMEMDQSHYIHKNRVDHTLLHPEIGKGYIPPTFHHHFGRRWIILHVRHQDTYAHNIMHAAPLHHRDCNNTFSSFSNLNPDSICLVRGGLFSHVIFTPAPYVEQLKFNWCNGWPMVLVTRAHKFSKLAFRGGVRIIILTFPNWSIMPKLGV